MDTSLILNILTLAVASIVLLVICSVLFTLWISRIISARAKHTGLGNSSKVRLIHNLKEAIIELSSKKIGAIITIEGHDNLDSHRTDGIYVNANISSALLIAIFNKESPLHDGAVIIRNEKIAYASTYYKISSNSFSNKMGARHRAAIGISEQTDAITIVVSEETGEISMAKQAKITKTTPDKIQEFLNLIIREK